MSKAQITVPPPTSAAIETACTAFDPLYEEALADLLNAFPRNNKLPQLLIKVVALNRLYSTQILGVENMARHMATIANLDARLADGDPHVVDEIAGFSIGSRTWHFSFATRFCSWHNPDAYPVQDARVDRYLSLLNEQQPFARFLRDPRWTATTFLHDMSSLRSTFHLEHCSFKDIDKFIWMTMEPQTD
jgi:hypothetical protein